MDLPFNSNITRIKNHSCVNDKSGHFFILTSCDRAEWCDFVNFKRVRERSIFIYPIKIVPTKGYICFS